MTTPTTPHPGPVSVRIPADLVQAVVDHARAGYPDEACGVIVGSGAAADGGEPVRWEPVRNAAASPYRYEIHPDDLLRLTLATEEAGEAFWAIVHSHVASPARPSPTDIGLAFYPDALYILVSLAPEEAAAGSSMPSVRAWRIIDGVVHEVELLVS